jgi:hypothetical protein
MSPGELEAALQARLSQARVARTAAHESSATGHSRRRKPLVKALIGGGLLTVLGVGAVVLGLVTDTADCSIEVANRSGYATCSTTQGGTVEYIGDLNTTFGSAGTGTFNSFVRVQASPTEQGYNTDGTLQFDTKSGNFTHSILVSDIPVVSVGGDLFWEIFADVNDSDNTPLISLNDIEVWFTDDPEITGYPFAAADAEKVYDLGGTVRIHDVNQGSGRGDVRLRIPIENIDIPDGCDYANADCEVYFVLYNRWGTTGGAYGSDGGFEEWKVKQYPTLKIVKNTIGGDGTFTYTVTGPSTPLVPAPSITTVGGTGSTITYIVDPGTYTIDEDGPPAGWTLDGAECSFNGAAASAYTEGANLVLGETSHVVCTFTNIAQGRIEIEKQTLPDGSTTDFTFTGDVAATLSDGESAGEDVAPGSYSSTETVPTGWELTDITCDDSDSTGDTSTGIASFEVDPGETVRCVFTNTQEVNEGCTPGFWKTHPEAWLPTGYSPGDTLESVFDVPDALGLDNNTLLEALSFNGGNTVKGAAKILLRAAVAALLNAAHPDVDYPRTEAEIIADVNAALASGDRSTMLTLAAALDLDNNAGCPLGSGAVSLSLSAFVGLPTMLATIVAVARRRRRSSTE